MTESTRRDFLRIAGAAVMAPLGGPGIRPSRAMRTLYVGTYTNGGGEGIYRCHFDTDTGAVAVQGVAGPIDNPSFLALDPSGRFLYAVSETSGFGDGAGGVAAYRIDPQNGRLTRMNVQSSGGGAPCYVTVTPDGGHVLVANYSGGSVAILPVESDGRLAQASDIRQHEGSGPNEDRQEGPHAHCIVVGPSGDRAFAADLGIDRIVVYDIRNGELVPSGGVSLAPGAGPRHFTFHPDGVRAYVINELDSTITAFDYEDGELNPTQTIGTLPDEFEGSNTTADVHVSGDGGFLYGSNRGHDSIAVFSIDPETGVLSPVEHVKTGGQTPRNFVLSPSGRFLLAANQRSDLIMVFAIDPEDGTLEATGETVTIPSPVCLRFPVDA